MSRKINEQDVIDTYEHQEGSTNRQKSQEEILVEQLCEGMEAYKQQNSKVFIGSVAAGLEIGFSYLLIVVLYTFLEDKFSAHTIPYLVAFAYPVGFIMVVLGRSILFTEQTSLLALPVLHGRRSVLQLLRLWGLVIAGNLIGGFFIALIICWVGFATGIISQYSIGEIAGHVTEAELYVIFGSAVLAGWLMALLSWLVTSSNETISRIFVIYMITAIVGFAGFHHSIVGNIEVLAGLLFTDDILFSTYVGFQTTALIGNAFGGVVFVALLKYRAFTANY
ncbi:formate/nitrite transporter family protein [Aggregatimonas sangjinii]|uniref:Formate/nitrite transporter family protein n=1 Tax=Aggregatimonas sangjinii TaxID=2583587 RepID=A0A5B7SR50_9FLAO|nr:formate/nitrite transporter family protein [Aggregatimonas sangjinii]QCW99447.1 formate/nitrite transporter family protein [Aggregatimonas sangjinii]